MAPRRRIRRQASRPATNVVNPKARRSWASGRGWMRRRASGDDAQRALAAHEELGQVRPGRGAGAGALRVHDAAVGQDDLEPDDHVLDLSVARRVLPGAPAGQPPTDGGEVHGLGPVPERVAVADLTERGLEIGAEGAGPHVGQERHLVDLVDAGARRHVERQAAVHGDGPAADAAAPRRRGDGHAGLVAGGEHGAHLSGRGGAHHGRRSLRDRTLGRPADGQGPPVAAGLGPCLVVGRPRRPRSRRCGREGPAGPRPCRRRGDPRRRRPPRRWG